MLVFYGRADIVVGRRWGGRRGQTCGLLSTNESGGELVQARHKMRVLCAPETLWLPSLPPLASLL